MAERSAGSLRLGLTGGSCGGQPYTSVSMRVELAEVVVLDTESRFLRGLGLLVVFGPVPPVWIFAADQVD